MNMQQQNENGRWVPAEPLAGTFGLRWEQMMRHRRSLGQGRLRALISGWRDVRAVDRASVKSERHQGFAVALDWLRRPVYRWRVAQLKRKLEACQTESPH